MSRWRQWTISGVFAWVVLISGRQAHAAAEVKLDKDFISGIVTKLPPASFEKEDTYRGSVHSYRLVAIEPRTRWLLVACQIEGEFRAPITGPISERVVRSPRTHEGWRKFRFDVKARVNIEPKPDGTPRFRIEIDEVKKRELEGLSGVVATVLGRYFDEIVTQLASGRASRLNKRLNDEITKRISMFNEYGVFRAIDYTPSEVILHFDVTRFKLESIAGYVYATEQPGTVPFYRWFHPRDGSHYYTIRPNAPDRPIAKSDGISCYIYDHTVPDAAPLFHWRKAHDHLFTIAADGEKASRNGYRFQEVAGYIYRDPKSGTVPLYRFFDPARGQHFYTRHPHAEFAK